MTLSASGSAGVASGHPLATEAGIAALRAGGTAVDAALAGAFTQWVVNAPQCGPGGEMVALVARAGTGTAQGSIARRTSDEERADRSADDARGDAVVYGGWSRAPMAIEDREASGEADAAGRGWPATSGPRNAVVPGSLRGADAVWRAHGRLGWGDLFGGALAAAAGHTVTRRMSAFYKRVEDRGHVQALERTLGTDEAPVEGTEIRLPALAATLEAVAAHGADVFYRGSLSDRLVAAAVSEGALLRHDDLAAVRAIVEPAMRFDLDDIVVWVPGAPSQAPITPVLLAAVEPGVDPASRQFAEAAAPLVEQRLTEFCARGPAPLSGTAVSTAVDSAGMSATVVHSLAGVQFGTGWVAGDTGVAFSNRVGTALSERRDLPGCNPRPGAVLPHTLSAAHVRLRARPTATSAAAGGERWMTVATPGGDRQVQWLAQAVQRFRLGVEAADITAGPRWFVCPTGDRFGVPAGIGEPWYAFAEPGIEWRDDERLAGYEVRPVDDVGGGLQLVAATDSEQGRAGSVEVASDPRSGGAAAAL